MNKKVLAMAVLASLSLTPAYAKDTTQELVQAVGNHVDEDGHIDGQSIGNQMVNQGIASGLSKALYGENAPDWLKRTEIQLYFQENWKPVYEIETIQPLNETEHAVAFTQFRLANSSDIGTTANIGFGYRKMNEAKTSLYGVNLFYDHGFRNDHARIGAGLEYFQGLNEFRANVYHGLSGEKEVDTTRHIFEKVVDGYDLELATSFKKAQWAKMYVQGYTWDYQHSDDVRGYKVGTEMQLTPRIAVDFGYNKENGASGEGYAKIMYSLGDKEMAWKGGKTPTEQAIPSVAHKMLQKVRRENDIRVERYQKDANGEFVPGTVQVSIKSR